MTADAGHSCVQSLIDGAANASGRALEQIAIRWNHLIEICSSFNKV